MDFQDLLAYKKSFALAMEIFEASKSFPNEEKYSLTEYSLTDQIRRSSRSVTTNISETYRKRRYPKHFISKLTDSDAENGKTQTWLKFSLECNYIDKILYKDFISDTIETGKFLNYMINHPNKFGVK